MPPSPRHSALDLIKALACMAIVWHHLAFYGPMSDIALPLAPGLMAWLYDHGRMAVQVFLVLGGYLAACSLAPQGVAVFGPAPSQIGKRYVRLVVPYVAALLLTVLVAALVRPVLQHPSVPADPDGLQLLANALMLQDLLGYEALSAGVWYVSIDFQLFALTVLVLAAARAALPSPRLQAWAGRGVLVLCTAASLWWLNRMPSLDAWAFYFVGSYGLGLMAAWAVQAPARAQAVAWALGMAALLAVALVLQWRTRIAVAGVTALCLVPLLRSRAVCQWQPRGVLAWLVQWGPRSYSVFLVHFAVCLLVNAVVSHLWPTHAALNALGMLLAFVLSMLAGWALYQGVERRKANWGTALRWQMGLLGAGALLELAF